MGKGWKWVGAAVFAVAVLGSVAPVGAQVEIPPMLDPTETEGEVRFDGPLADCPEMLSHPPFTMTASPGENGPTLWYRGEIGGRFEVGDTGWTFNGESSTRRITTAEGDEYEEVHEDSFDAELTDEGFTGEARASVDGVCEEGAIITILLPDWASQLPTYVGLGANPTSLGQLNAYSDGETLYVQGSLFGVPPGTQVRVYYDQSGAEYVFGEGFVPLNADGTFLYMTPLEAEGFCAATVSVGPYSYGWTNFDCTLGSPSGTMLDIEPTITDGGSAVTSDDSGSDSGGSSTSDDSSSSGGGSDGSTADGGSGTSTEGESGGGGNTGVIAGGIGAAIIGGAVVKNQQGKKTDGSTSESDDDGDDPNDTPPPSASTQEDAGDLLLAGLSEFAASASASPDAQTEWTGLVNREDTIQLQLKEDWIQTGEDIVETLNDLFTAIDGFREPWTRAWSGTTDMQGLLTEGQEAIDVAKWADMVWGFAQLGRGVAVGGYKAAVYLSRPDRLPCLGHKIASKMGWVDEVDLNAFRSKYFQQLQGNSDLAIGRLAEEAGIDWAEWLARHGDNVDDAGTALMLEVAKQRGWVMITDDAAAVITRLSSMSEAMKNGTLSAADQARFAADFALLEEWAKIPGFWEKLGKSAGWIEESARFGDTYDAVEVLEILFSPKTIEDLQKLLQSPAIPRLLAGLEDAKGTVRLPPGSIAGAADDATGTVRLGGAADDATDTVRITQNADETATQLLHVDDVTKTQVLQNGVPVVTTGPAETVILGANTPPTVLWQGTGDLAGDLGTLAGRTDAPTVHLPGGGLGVDDATVILNAPGAAVTVPPTSLPGMGATATDATWIMTGSETVLDAGEMMSRLMRTPLDDAAWAETRLNIGEFMQKLMDTPLDDVALNETRLDIHVLMQRLMDTPLEDPAHAATRLDIGVLMQRMMDTPLDEAAYAATKLNIGEFMQKLLDTPLGDSFRAVLPAADDAAGMAQRVAGVDDATVILDLAGDGGLAATRILGQVQPPTVILGAGAAPPPTVLLGDSAATQLLVDGAATVIGQWRGPGIAFDAAVDATATVKLPHLPSNSGLSMTDNVIDQCGIDVDFWNLRCGGEPTAYEDLISTVAGRCGWQAVPEDVAAACDTVLTSGRAAVANGGGSIPADAIDTLRTCSQDPAFWPGLTNCTADFGDGTALLYSAADADFLHTAVSCGGNVATITDALGPMRANAMKAAGRAMDAGTGGADAAELFFDPAEAAAEARPENPLGPPKVQPISAQSRAQLVERMHQSINMTGPMGQFGVENIVDQFGNPGELDGEFHFAWASWHADGDGGVGDTAITFFSRLGRVLTAPLESLAQSYYTTESWEMLQEFYENNPETFNDMTMAYNDAIRSLERLESALGGLDDPETPLGGAAASGLEQVLDDYESAFENMSPEDQAATKADYDKRRAHIEQKLSHLRAALRNLGILRDQVRQYQEWLRGLLFDENGKPDHGHKLMSPETVVRLLGTSMALRELTSAVLMLPGSEGKPAQPPAEAPPSNRPPAKSVDEMLEEFRDPMADAPPEDYDIEDTSATEEDFGE